MQTKHRNTTILKVRIYRFSPFHKRDVTFHECALLQIKTTTTLFKFTFTDEEKAQTFNVNIYFLSFKSYFWETFNICLSFYPNTYHDD